MKPGRDWAKRQNSNIMTKMNSSILNKYGTFLFSKCFSDEMCSKETREGWPLLTVETEVNGDSKSTNERGPSLLDSLGLSRQYKRFFSAFAALVGPAQIIFSLTVHYFNFFVLIAHQAGQ